MSEKKYLLDYRSIFIFIGFFLITISNIYIFDKAKIIGILLILALAYIEVFKYGISNKDLLYFILFFVLFVGQILFQQLTINQIINAIFYYIVLLTMVILGKNILKNGKDFYLCTLSVGLANLIGFFYSPTLLIQQIMRSGSRVRVYGSFTHPNALGSIIIMCLISGMIYLSTIDKISNKQKKVSIVFCLFLIFQLILTDSRGYLILFVVIISIYFLKNTSNKSILYKYTIFLVLSILGIYFIYFFWNYYIIEDASYLSRLQGFNSLNLSGIKYWFGYGMVSSNDINYEILDGGSMEIAWVKMLYKVGMIGVVLFILILLKVFFTSKKIKNCKIKYAFYATYFSFLVGSLVESSLVTIFNANPILIWISLSSIPNIEKRRKNI